MAFRSKSHAVGAVLIFVCVPFWSGAFARDLETLTRLLIPAYIAQDFAALCATRNPDFLSSEVTYGVTSINAYAQHVKKEITIGIPEDVSQTVRVTAADTAREVARRELHLLTAQQAANHTDVVKRWCERSAKPFILAILRKHQENHREYDDILANAKR